MSLYSLGYCYHPLKYNLWFTWSVSEERMKRKGKIVYRPPEKSYTNVNIEETPYGYKLYREGSSKHFSVIPFSAVTQIIYDRGE